MPKQGANRDFYIQNQERELALTDGTTPGGALAKITDAGRCFVLFSIIFRSYSIACVHSFCPGLLMESKDAHNTERVHLPNVMQKQHR